MGSVVCYYGFDIPEFPWVYNSINDMIVNSKNWFSTTDIKWQSVNDGIYGKESDQQHGYTCLYHNRSCSKWHFIMESCVLCGVLSVLCNYCGFNPYKDTYQ